MCTALSYKTEGFYFGRTLDHDVSYPQTITVMPRDFELKFRHTAPIKSHYAIMGIAYVANDYPLYFDAVNEKGLCIAGLNFPGNAVYGKPIVGCDNIAQFELIPWLLCQCADVEAVKSKLSCINITDTPFSSNLPTAQLHWIIADENSCITVEATAAGLNIYDNPVGVLTNNPSFDKQLVNLNNYINLTAEQPTNRFSDSLNLKAYSLGMGAIGLPGDLSSMSRFVRAAFVKQNCVCGKSEADSVGAFFHVMDSVAQPMGCNRLGNEKYEATLYTVCCNANKGIYYYTTYSNRQITAIDMHRADLNSGLLQSYPLINTEQIKFQN